MIRGTLAVLFFVLGMVAIAVLESTLSPEMANVLLDNKGATYPFSVQNAMWIIFFVGIAELVNRFREARLEGRQLSVGYLPEDERTVLVKAMLPDIYKKTSLMRDADRYFLPNMIKRIIASFQATNSVENAGVLLNSSLELRSHDLDLKYSMLRYIMWVIPTLGFIGTVIGIALALNYAGLPGKAQDPNLLTDLTARLAVAFNTTMVALMMSAILVLAMHIVQNFEERVLNRCGEYCLDNLVNRLYRAETAEG